MADRSHGVFRRRRVAPPHRRTIFALPGASLPPDGSAPSTLRVKALTFAKATATGLQTISGVGFQGAALLIWTTRQTSHAVTDGAQACLGMTDGVAQACRSIHHPDNEATTTSAQAERTNRLGWMTSATSGAAPTLQVEGEFVGWTADGFTIRWHTNDADATLFHVLVIGGVQASLQPVKVTVNAGGTIVRTGLGFAPQAFVVLGGAADEYGGGDYSSGAPAGSIHGFGFSNAVDNMTGWTLGRGTGGAADTYRGQHTDRVTSVREAILSGAADLCAIQITAVSSDGFTVTRTVGTTTHQPVQHILCLRGARFAMGSFNTPAAVGDLALSLPVQPAALLLQTHGLNATTGDGMSLAFGAWQNGTEGGTWIGGTDNANPSVYARASYTDALLKSYTPAATGSASPLQAQASVASVTGAGVTLTFSAVPATAFPILYLAIGDGAEDGTVPAGTNPVAGFLPSETPQFFITVEDVDDGTIAETFAEQLGGPFNDDPDYKGGFKERRVISFGSLARKANTPGGGVQGSPQTIVLDDSDRYFADNWAVIKRLSKKCATWVVDHGDRLAKLAPFQLKAGLITDHGPGSDDFTWQFTVEGMMARHFSPTKSETMVPKIRLTPDVLPALAARWADGFSPPIGYGFLDDESSAKPQGVVPGIYAGTANLQAIYGPGAVNILGDFFVFFGHAVQDTLNLYYTPPGWTASTAYLAGDLIRTNLTSNGYLYRCTVAGTSGSSAPSFSTTIGATFSDGSVTWQNVGVDDPDLRFPVPADAYGQIVADPHKAGWTAVTGTTARYTEWGGYRMHVVIVRNSHRFAQALRENRMTLSGNFRGIEDIGDGTGALITSPSRIQQHFWCNFVERTYTTGNWGGVPAFGSYSLFDTDTVEALHTYTQTLVSGGPVRASMLIGRNGQQMQAYEAWKQMSASWDIKPFENRHGQIALAMTNPSAPAATTFTDQDDALQLRPSPRRANYANVVRYWYGPRFVPPVATQLEGAQGQPMPAKNTHDYANWVSGMQTLPDATAIAQNNGEDVYLDLYLWGVRDAATAAMYAARALAQAVGPVAAREGPVGMSLVTGLQGLEQASVLVDVGTTIGLTHVAGLGSGGYTGATFCVDEIDPQAETCTVRLAGDLLT